MPSPKPRTTSRTRVANVDAALKEREQKSGKTITLKSIRDGYYGVEGGVADIRKPGTVFQFAVRDLELITDEAAFAKAEYMDGTPKRAIEIDGKRYMLPSWCVDPKASDADEDEDSETPAPTNPTDSAEAEPVI